MNRRTTPIEERLFPRIDASGPCWLWTGAKSIGGYGVINRGRRGDGNAMVHRLVWELLVGPVPEGFDLDHLCRVRACCNPDHLEPVTRAENVARGAWRAGLGRVTSCKHGHLFTPENTKSEGRRGRACRTCCIDATKRWRARQEEKS
jgi:hypothetical protein